MKNCNILIYIIFTINSGISPGSFALILHIIFVIRRVSISRGSGVTDLTDSAVSGGDAARAAPEPLWPRLYAVNGYIPYLKIYIVYYCALTNFNISKKYLFSSVKIHVNHKLAIN